MAPACRTCAIVVHCAIVARMQGDLIRAREAAAILGIDPSNLSRWVLAGKITPEFKAPGYKGMYLFDRAAVEQFQAQRESAA